MLRQLCKDRVWQQPTLMSTTRTVWSRGKPSNQPNPTTPPPHGKLSATHPQIQRSLLDDSRRHFCPPRLAPHHHVTFGPAVADPMHNTSASFHILDGECDQTQITASHYSTGLQIFDASTYRRPRISTRPRSPEHFIIIFGIIVHLCLMYVCVMSNAHYPNLLRSLSTEDFLVWKLVLATVFL